MQPPRSPARRPARWAAIGLCLGVIGVVFAPSAGARPPADMAGPVAVAVPAPVPAPGADETAAAAPARASDEGTETAQTAQPAPGTPQTAGRAPFPADRVAFMPTVESGPGAPPVGPIPPPLALSDLYLASGTDAASPEVVLRFAEPFKLPDDGYRLSVLVGDPLGPRLSASLLASGGRDAGNAAAGVVSRFEGFGWQDVGPTDVQFDDLGFALITLPLGIAPPGSSVWVEISVGSPLLPQRVSPFFSRAALFDKATAGVLPGDGLGVSRDRRGRPDQMAVPLGDPPTVAVRQGAAVVETGTLPIQVLGQPVTGVVDTVRLVDSYNRGGRAAEVRLDRGKGTVGLYDTSVDPPADRTGDRTWLRRPPAPPGAAAAPEPSGSA
jgi:hypothetical protein